ncbi:MAG TPA: SDR family oxidoreductase, partial [Sphingomonadaceae bacterium]|nr:SDR family oxidoreductase [Sphingomonadaceae bacterium]
MSAPVILVTGSSRGIGAAIVEQLQARNCLVICHASRPYDDDTIVANFNEPLGPQIVWDEALERSPHGRIDAVINNAGIFEANPIAASDIDWLDRWEDTLRINLTAAAQLSRYAVKHWLEHEQGGRLVHIASRAGHRGDSPEHWHYAASKGGMLALHKTIARGYALNGILSFAIAP